MNAPQTGFKNYWASSGSQASVLQQYIDKHFIHHPDNYSQEKSIAFHVLDATNEINDLSEELLLVETDYLTFKRRAADAFFCGLAQ